MSILDSAHNGTHNLNFISLLFILKSQPFFTNQSIFSAVADAATAAKEIDASKETGDIMTRIKVSIRLIIVWLGCFVFFQIMYAIYIF